LRNIREIPYHLDLNCGVGLDELEVGTVRLCHKEGIPLLAIEGDTMFLADTTHRKFVGNTAGVIPHSTVSWKITNTVGATRSSIGYSVFWLNAFPLRLGLSPTLNKPSDDDYR
jgi:hypothetical protein